MSVNAGWTELRVGGFRIGLRPRVSGRHCPRNDFRRVARVEAIPARRMFGPPTLVAFCSRAESRRRRLEIGGKRMAAQPELCVQNENGKPRLGRLQVSRPVTRSFEGFSSVQRQTAAVRIFLRFFRFCILALEASYRPVQRFVFCEWNDHKIGEGRLWCVGGAM